MYTVPDMTEVVEVAAGLGIHLGSDEAALYQRYLAQRRSAVDEFVQSRVEEEKPPLLSPSREPGYRPSPEEDPLNAWTWKCRIEGAEGGVLSGKTVSYKDQIAIAGIPMSIGSFAMEGFIPDFDATVVTRVLAAGGTVVGHNTQNGLGGGRGSGGNIGDYGRPKNPHDPAHITGGSSAGSGAAVAAGEVDIAFGGDQGGSIRMPAALSGCIGLKPTFGLVSHFGIGFGSDQSIDYTGPMARTVEDVAAALQATAGYDGYDPRQTRQVPRSMDVFSGLTRGASGLRIGVLEEGFSIADPLVTEAVMAAVEVLAEAGAEISKISVPEHSTARIPQNRFLRSLHPDVLPGVAAGGGQQTLGPSGRPPGSADQARLHRRRVQPAQLLRPRLRQSPKRTPSLHQGLRLGAVGGGHSGDADLPLPGANL
jgi:amidase